MDESRLDYEIAIIGTGFAGLAMAIKLDRLGLSKFVMLEKAGDIGGTWRDNQYPGACCDVPSQLYSFSFELNPRWSRRFSSAKEIHDYQQQVADKYGLKGRTRCGFEVATASYDEHAWNLTSTRGEQLYVRFLISAVGALHIPKKPKFTGLDEFTGKVMHSAEWDSAYDPSGRKIVVVGSAASAIQIIPQLAKVAEKVSVIQRTASYFIPRSDRRISKTEQRLFRSFPFIQRLARWWQYCFNDFLFHPNFVNRPSLSRWYVHRMVVKHMKQQIHDPELWEKLQPPYAIGCKRLLLSDDYLPALQQANVSLLTSGISHFTGDSLVTADGQEITADTVVLATGFESSRLVGHMKISGSNNLSLDEVWADQISAHRSVAVDGFPNFFIMYGPNSNLGHSSIIIMLETQAKYIAGLINHARQKSATRITVRSEVQAKYNEKIQESLLNTVWSTDCNSWYKDENGYIFSLWPHTTTRFIREMKKASPSEFTFH